MKELKVEYIPKEELKPYANNAKIHTGEQVDQIKKSIQQFGFNDPIAIWHDNEIIEGHGRLLAAMEMPEVETVPVIRLDDLTDEQRRAYMLVHNKLTMNTPFDVELLDLELEELEELEDIDMSDYGFESDWFKQRERNDRSREEGNEEYNEFIEKFETKKTTDDCYTPDIVYDAIAGWVSENYNLDRKCFKRPFYPGGNYQAEKYKETDIVVDNPPFSILAEIVRFYTEKEIRFFLFAPTMTLFSSSSSSCALPCGGKITYENGAVVATSFLTNLENYRVRVIPQLYKIIEEADAKNQESLKRTLPKYKYPDHVLSAAMCRYLCEHDTEFLLERKDSYHIRQLDSQKEYNDSTIFGSGYLLSEKAAAEKAAAEKAAAEKAAAKVWELSEREKEIIARLG